MIGFELRSNQISALMAAMVPMEELPNSSRVEYLCRRGNELMAKAKYSEALMQFDSAVACQSNDAAAWLGRGQALYWGGRHQNALESLERAADLCPQPERRVLLAQAQVWLALRLPQRALDCCNVALAAASRGSTSEYRRAQYLKFKSLVQLRRYTELFVNMRESLGTSKTRVEESAETYLTAVSPVTVSFEQN